LKNTVLGAKDSCEGSCEFALNAACHPIVTSKQMISAINYLKEVAVSEEWAEIAEILAPELSELVLNWDDLSYKERGAKSGYVFGKYGTDCLIGGGLMKAGKMTAKQLTGLVAARTSLLRAEQILAMESALSFGKTGMTAIEEMGAGFGSGLSEEAMLASIQKFKSIETTLQPYTKSFFSENEIRSILHKCEIKTFPRPKGIPDNFLVRVTDRGAGMEYCHPQNSHISIRVMPGKPHIPNLAQQKPYVIHKKDGKAFDKSGNLINQKDLEAHVPIEDFIYRE
jgi:hypothetical protein